MATRDEARFALERRLNKYQPKMPRRTVFLGDGRGFAASNMYVPGQTRFVYARESIGDDRYFPIRNVRITPQFNQPVIAGYLSHEPDVEQVIDIDHDANTYIPGGTGGSYGSPGIHGGQHEFGGGDEVYIDPRLFLPGLLKPTNPPSASVKIESFAYYYNQWDRYPGSTTAAFTQYKPSGVNTRYVMVALEPETREIVFRPGLAFSSSGNPAQAAVNVFPSASWNGWEGKVPGPAGNEYPIGAIRMTASTTTIDWFDTQGSEVIIEARLHITPPWKRVLDRIAGIENSIGIGTEQALPATGAQTGTADKFLANAGQIHDVNVEKLSPTHGDALVYSASKNMWSASPISAVGEANTISNLGTGIGIFREKSGVDLQIRTISPGIGINIASSTSIITITSASKSEVFLPATTGWPSTTNGCSPIVKREYPTNDVDMFSLDFSSDTSQYAQWAIWMPDSWDGGTITYRAVWTASSGTPGQDISWIFSGRSYASSDAIDSSWGTGVNKAASLITVDDIHYTDESSPVTLAGGPAPGELVQLRIGRDHDSDNLTGMGKLLGIKIYYIRQ